MKVKQKSADMDSPLETFQHTHIAVYLCGLFAVACVCYDSIQVLLCPSISCVSMTLGSDSSHVCDCLQGVMQKYALNRKWFYLYGTLQIHMVIAATASKSCLSDSHL